MLFADAALAELLAPYSSLVDPAGVVGLARGKRCRLLGRELQRQRGIDPVALCEHGKNVVARDL